MLIGVGHPFAFDMSRNTVQWLQRFEFGTSA